VFSIERRVGRLLEIRIGGAWTLEEVVDFGSRFRQVSESNPSMFIACTDLRGARLLPPEAADLMLAFMRTRKTKIEYNAVLIGDSPIIGLQVDRLIKGASHPGRQIVRAVGEVTGFLDPLCTAEERQRLRQFLDEG
jgi:hypothetical protein